MSPSREHLYNKSFCYSRSLYTSGYCTNRRKSKWKTTALIPLCDPACVLTSSLDSELELEEPLPHLRDTTWAEVADIRTRLEQDRDCWGRRRRWYFFLALLNNAHISSHCVTAADLINTLCPSERGPTQTLGCIGRSTRFLPRTEIWSLQRPRVVYRYSLIFNPPRWSYIVSHYKRQNSISHIIHFTPGELIQTITHFNGSLNASPRRSQVWRHMSGGCFPKPLHTPSL